MKAAEGDLDFGLEKQIAEFRAQSVKATIRLDIAKFAMMGLLADHKDHADELRPGETCAQAVARLAYDQAEAMLDEAAKRWPT
jgi:hypothetical protein